MKQWFVTFCKKTTWVMTLGLLLFLNRQTWPAQAQTPLDVGSLAAGETARVIVNLRVPEAHLTTGLRVELVEQSQTEVLETIPPPDFHLVQQFETVPGLVGDVTAQGIEALLAHPAVASVALDLPVEIALTESARVIGAEAVWRDWGLTGSGVTVAVLDTGIDPAHPDLVDNLIAQKCFGRGFCPPNNSNQSDSAQDGNGHGTHIAGIISGRGQSSPRGIAPDADIVAVKVLADNGSGYTSDVIAAIDWVIAHQADLNVQVINLSLGGGAYKGVCDAADANTQLYAQAVELARQAGITVFAAAGNQGQTNALMAPACVSGVISMGATYDANLGTVTLGSCTDENVMVDQIACASNRGPELDLLAPGISIVSTAPGGGERNESGTSMSTAHASAVAALLRQAEPGLLPDEIETMLEETGVPITDQLTGRIFPRIDALAAVARVSGAHTVNISGTVLLQSRANHSGTQVYLSDDDGCTSPVATGAALVTTGPDGYFEVSVAVAPQNQPCVQVVHHGYLVGQYLAANGHLGILTLPGGDMTGDGIIDIFDLSYIAARIGTTDPLADLIPDGKIDIFDVVIAAGNYNKQGPVNNWQ
jgi:subtilisin family serine protease